MTNTVSPANNPAYIYLREEARKRGLGGAFSRMSMLLDAPADLIPFFTVMAGVNEILRVPIPASWDVLDEVFGGWSAVADWALRNREVLETTLRRDAIEIERSIVRIENSGKKDKRHSMSGHNLTGSPIYALLCGTHASSNYLTGYALLRLQLLICRWKWLCEFRPDSSEFQKIECRFLVLPSTTSRFFANCDFGKNFPVVVLHMEK